MPNPPPPVDMCAWDSYAYWRADGARAKQCWYVSFCLMMSSVQDRLTGLALAESENLNWATTAFYYSAMHAGRLLFFVCSGDYPTQHRDMNAILEGGNGRAKVDWLKKFHGYIGTPGTAGGVEEKSTAATDLRASLMNAVAASCPGSDAAVQRFMPLLPKFKNLRNDSNYEALLVAHERNHFLVTDTFRKLTCAADKASAISVDMAIGLYLEHVKSAQQFQAEHGRFLSAHRLYLRGRFEQSLSEKFKGSPRALAVLREAIAALATPDNPPGEAGSQEVEAFLEPIMYGQFGQKQGLMDRWEGDVASLEAVVGV